MGKIHQYLAKTHCKARITCKLLRMHNIRILCCAKWARSPEGLVDVSLDSNLSTSLCNSIFHMQADFACFKVRIISIQQFSVLQNYIAKHALLLNIPIFNNDWKWGITMHQKWDLTVQFVPLNYCTIITVLITMVPDDSWQFNLHHWIKIQYVV